MTLQEFTVDCKCPYTCCKSYYIISISSFNMLFDCFCFYGMLSYIFLQFCLGPNVHDECYKYGVVYNESSENGFKDKHPHSKF